MLTDRQTDTAWQHRPRLRISSASVSPDLKALYKFVIILTIIIISSSCKKVAFICWDLLTTNFDRLTSVNLIVVAWEGMVSNYNALFWAGRYCCMERMQIKIDTAVQTTTHLNLSYTMHFLAETRRRKVKHLGRLSKDIQSLEQRTQYCTVKIMDEKTTFKMSIGKHQNCSAAYNCGMRMKHWKMCWR